MTDNFSKEKSFVSNEKIINELTKDIESVAIQQPETEPSRCEQECSASEEHVPDEEEKDSLQSSEDEKEISDDDDLVDETHLQELEVTLSDDEMEVGLLWVPSIQYL